MPKLFALLVGIDQYPEGVPPLGGCGNDTAAFATFLQERVDRSRIELRVETLNDDGATRQNIIEGFRKHLSDAREDDVALFYYSGHGSQNHTPAEFWHLEPDHLDETLVCYDSRLDGKYDLADKEIAVLIAEVSKKNPHVLVILDSCHSGSGTRAPLRDQGAAVRRAVTDLRVRPIDSYLAPGGELERLVTAKSGKRYEWLMRPRGRHIVMAACREDEEARETAADGHSRGLFSYCLTQSLEVMGTRLTYRDLFKRVNALVRIKAAGQSPLIEATDSGDLDGLLFDGAIQAHAPYFTARFDRDQGWVIDAGAVHGIPTPSGGETTRLAVFPVTTEKLEDVQAAIGDAAVLERLPAQSTIALTLKTGEPSESLTYKAAITSLPLAPLRFMTIGDPEALGLLLQALATAGPGGGASLLVRHSDVASDLRVIATPTGYRIQRTADDRGLVIDVAGANPDSARRTILRLEHIARWTTVAELRNPATRLAADTIKIQLFAISASGEEAEVDVGAAAADLRFRYELVDGEWRKPRFKILITNQSIRRLYFVLLDLPDSYSIYSGLFPGSGQWLDPGQSAWAMYRNSPVFSGEVPADLVAQGLTEIKDTLKVIASTEECDATLLDQADLDVHFEPSRGAHRGQVFTNTLANLMRRVQTRHLGQSTDALADWTTAQTTITIEAPGANVVVPHAGKAAKLSDRVQVLPHPGLEATARLRTAVAATRDADLPALPPLPPWLVDDPDIVRPFEFSTSRGGEAGLSVLELNDVEPQSARTVTREAPLRLRIQVPLAEDEHVLPVSFDGEFFLPLGKARSVDGEVEVDLDLLPEPSTNRRTLTGSIRIFFKKVVSRYIGNDYAYPLLAIAEPDGSGGVRYTVDQPLVRAKIQAARRILLYIHGIIGDTRGMAASAFASGLAGNAGASPWDLVLTFDYENLNTPIQETAVDLKHRLAGVGLDATSGKDLHVIAHSMGGLVARWYIEREGGDSVARHLVMAGTPNGGSPWPNAVDWAMNMMAVGLNGLSHIPWPPTVLGMLAALATRGGAVVSKYASNIEVALDDMKPGSKLLDELSRTPRVPIPYSIVAGNTSLVAAALTADASRGSRIERLLQRLNPANLATEQATALAFFGLPNDIAVSVEAISNVPRSAGSQTVVREITCDHMSYFSSETGMKTILEIVNGPAASSTGL